MRQDKEVEKVIWVERNMKNKCQTCQINNQAIEEEGCCIWYMDNVVLGNKSADDCPKYKKIKEEKKNEKSRNN